MPKDVTVREFLDDLQRELQGSETDFELAFAGIDTVNAMPAKAEPPRLSMWEINASNDRAFLSATCIEAI